MARSRIEQGLVQVYTGDGKGKTTAALGVALRALGWGLRVCVVQFIKGYQDTGEMKIAERFASNYVVRQFTDDPTCFIDESMARERSEACAKAMDYAEEVIASGKFDVVILDEINNAMAYELVDSARVIAMIRHKPKHIEVILTGRRAPQEIIEAADLVTEMVAVKHPFDEKGTQARVGIDY